MCRALCRKALAAEPLDPLLVAAALRGADAKEVYDLWYWDLQPLFRVRNNEVSGKKNVATMQGGKLRQACWKLTGKAPKAAPKKPAASASSGSKRAL